MRPRLPAIVLLLAALCAPAWSAREDGASAAGNPAADRAADHAGGKAVADDHPAKPPPKEAVAPPTAKESAPEIASRIAAARDLLEKDDFEGALAKAREIVAGAPESADALALLGDALYRRGDFDEAEKAYRGAVAKDEACAAGQFGVGRILRTLGRYGDAAAWFHRAATLEPDNPLYIRTLANHLARREDAIAMLEHYLEMTKNSEEERLRKNVAAWVALLEYLGDEPLSQVVRSEPTDLPMNVLRGQAYFKAKVNKLKGQRFAFDTGSTGMTVSPRLAKRAKLETIRPYEIVGMGGKGTVAGDLVLIRNLSVGGITLHNVTANVAEPKGPEEGLVGPPIFGSFLIRIDLDRGDLWLLPRDAKGAGKAAAPDAGEGAVEIPFRNVGGQIIVPASLDGTTLNAMVDTGASSSLSSFSALDRVPGLETLSAALTGGRSFGLGGEMARKTIRKASLSFGGRDFTANGMPCVDLSRFSHAIESEIYLVIGFPELSRFVIELDYATNTLRLEPRRD